MAAVVGEAVQRQLQHAVGALGRGARQQYAATNKYNIMYCSTVEWIYLLFGMFIAFIVSVFAIKFLLNYLKRNDFTGFGKYRIVLGAIIILYSLFQF